MRPKTLSSPHLPTSAPGAGASRLQLLKSQSPDETAFAYHMIGLNANSSKNTNILNDSAKPIINL